MNTIRVSNGLDSDQDKCSVGSDLDPNCLQRLSVGKKKLPLRGKSYIHWFEFDLIEVYTMIRKQGKAWSSKRQHFKAAGWDLRAMRCCYT